MNMGLQFAIFIEPDISHEDCPHHFIKIEYHYWIKQALFWYSIIQVIYKSRSF